MPKVTAGGVTIGYSNWLVRTVICALALSMTVPAPAQQTGSRLKGSSGAMVFSDGEPETGPRPTDEAIRILRGLSKCLAQTKRKDASRYLGSKSEEDQKAVLAKLSPSMTLCLTDAGPGAANMSIGGAAFRGSLAEALLAHQDLHSLAPIEPSKTEVPYWLSDQADQRVVEEMAICLSDRDPQNSVKLVQSDPGSPMETTAFAALTPLLGPCLIQGTTLHANRVGIRLALADAVYHRVADTVGAPVDAGGGRK